MLPPVADRPKLNAVLDQLSTAVEELLLGGLTTASDATRQTLAVATQEAARFRLLRLGSTLRAVTEELGRYTNHDPAFSRRRLSFFLNRGWLLSRGISHALRSNDDEKYDTLNWTPRTTPVPNVDVVCLGVVKKVAAGSFVMFEFRLRATVERGPIASGQRLTWSAVFPVKQGVDIPAEGYLHLPQKQKFKPTVFLEKKVVSIQNTTVSLDESGGGRLSLTEQSTVSLGTSFTEWERFLTWSPEPALERLRQHKPGPLDLENELQDEIVLRDYSIGSTEDGVESDQSIYPITANRLTCHATVDNETSRKAVDELRKVKKNPPPLFGVMHYERCRLVMQPLSTIDKDGPEYLTISKANINKAALLKAMSFT